MVSPVRLLLACNDAVFLAAFQTQLRRHHDGAFLACRYDAVRSHLDPRSDGLIFALATGAADAPAVRGLAQELKLLNAPARVALIEAAGAQVAAHLGPFETLLAGRVAAENTRELTALARSAGDGRGFVDPARESLPERIARRLIGVTPSLAPLVDSLVLAAAHDVNVLIDGEAGTGKTFLARLIHDHSPRAAHRFLVVGCAALAPGLIESELFGHAKGSIAGSEAAKVGKFAAAGAGTLLLDEIDSLGPEQQANVLRVLETGEFEPVGGTEAQPCAARVIAASNWNLDEACERGAFRRDLFYRLNVMPFHLPPLRERPRDIEPLVRSLVARFAAKFRKDLVRIHPETLRVLAGFDWPGNIRQLENVVQQAVLLSHGPELVVKNLAPIVQNRVPAAAGPARVTAGALEQSRQAAERVSIMRALEAANYCRTHAAAALGISRVTLYKKMRDYGLLVRPAFAGRRAQARA